LYVKKKDVVISGFLLFQTSPSFHSNLYKGYFQYPRLGKDPRTQSDSPFSNFF